MAQAQLQEVVSYWDLAQALTDIPTTIRWCRDRQLLAAEMVCESCGKECREVKRPRYPEGVCWRCPRKGCQKLFSLRHNSCFSNSKLSVEMILRLLHNWSTRTPLGDVIKEVKIGSESVVRWYDFARDVCAQYLVDHRAEIGEPGTHPAEHMWRQKFDTPSSNAFSNILKHIAEQYPQ